MVSHMQLTQDDAHLLRSLISETFELSSVVIEHTTALIELEGVDSMKVLRLVAAVERSFGIDLGFEAIPQIHTVTDLERLVIEARAAKAARQLSLGA
jgi:acyl carrier protein